MAESQQSADAVSVGRYAIFDVIGSGGMASVHLGRLLGPGGFSRTVAIKRLHSEFAKDPDFVAMLLEEARLASRIRHPNVVSMLDVVHESDELFLVMDYIEGESLSRVLRASSRSPLPLPIVSSVLSGVLQGLHAAHEAMGEDGHPLQIVHRDVSPQNILLGVDGTARVTDFGVAKSVGRVGTTRDGRVKGKAGYMAPEQLRGGRIDRRVDTYAATIVLWEMLTGRRLFVGETPEETMLRALERVVDAPGQIVRGIPPELDALVMRGLDRTPSRRFETALAMSAHLERVIRPATARETADWLKSVIGSELDERVRRRVRIESTPSASAMRSIGASVALVAQTGDAPSQVSSISVTTPKGVMPSGLRGAWSLGALVVGALTVAALFFHFGHVGQWGPTGSPSTGSSSPLAGGAASANLASPVLPENDTGAPAVPTATVASLAVAHVNANAPDASPSSGATHGPSRTHMKPRQSLANCTPPYTVDPSGIHVAKPECL
jgi:serine/threonine-protein kinase